MSCSLYSTLCFPAGSAGASSAPPTTIVSPNQTWDSGGGRDGGVAMENGARGGALPENWELAFSDTGEPYYIKWVSRGRRKK